MKLSGKSNRITLSANGKRCGVNVSAGPWVSGVNPEQVKIYCKKGLFPNEIKEAFNVINNSDTMEDYFENDQIKLLPGHPLYESAKAISQ